jgi:hypothetical protein
MEEPIQSDLAGTSAERVRALEKAASTADGAPGHVRTMVGIASFTGVVAVAGLVVFLFFVQGHVGANVAAISGLRSEVADFKAQHAHDIGILEKSMERLEEKLTQRSSGGGATAGSEEGEQRVFYEDVGTVGHVDKDSIAIEWKNGDITGKTVYPVAVGARISVKGQLAKLQDLKPGMTVRLLHKEGKSVEIVETVEESESEGEKSSMGPSEFRNSYFSCARQVPAMTDALIFNLNQRSSS